MIYYLVEGINPEPWEAPTASIGRKNGKTFVHMHKNAGQRAYQEGFADAFKEQNDDWQYFDDKVELEFHFWRQVDRDTKANIADVTNLQKATEDALQGILFPNDRLVVKATSRIVQQGPDVEPKVLVGIQYDDGEPDAHILGMVAVLHKELPAGPSNIREVPDVF